MENLWEEENGVFEVAPGAQIAQTINEAIGRAKKEKRPIAFDFNGVRVTVTGNSCPDLIERDWFRAMNGYIAKIVGPNPAPELTKAEKQNDAAMEAKNEEERQKSQKEYEAAAQEKKRAVDRRLEIAPPMKFKDKKSWDDTVAKNQDAYGGAVMIYAEQWARLMELEMSQGKELKDIAYPTSHEADTDGITGFMYGCAVSILSHCWIHGEELRRWHNLKTQIKDEGEKANKSGGVLNPAILSVG